MTDLTDVEIDMICDGYKQSAAKVRYLQSIGLTVRRKPNGRPLINRTHYDAITGGGSQFAPAAVDYQPNWGTH
jgi:hypothetical protein